MSTPAGINADSSNTTKALPTKFGSISSRVVKAVASARRRTWWTSAQMS
ncbi:hypothetical protein ACFUJR_29265 [Streptomyces sp. NPDC057271]